ncbi:SHOCT domain-containing protein [Sulfurospirillum sp. UCH001]|uniref:SHOCT domain-containing protein n=1 Tax=Sulfurospirillum sp. UCH001 TaxID=1581011 RepID=UPI00082EA71B|nr:SHOCT domain-containing protein [Sulfurospirillum sp. UCH001]
MYVNQWMGHGFFMPWLILFPIICVILFVLMRGGRSCYSEPKEDDALEIARKRFARGEIDEVTFEKIKEKLSA